MPNWVFNRIDDYPKELYDKYKSEDNDLDFNKVIPEPEEITYTPSGSFNDIAKNIHNYKKFIDGRDKNETIPIHRDAFNPLKDPVRHMSENITQNIGSLVIESPDKPLNELLENEDNSMYKHQYDRYTKVFGNNMYKNIKDFNKVYDSYIELNENEFQDYKQNIKKDSIRKCYDFDSLDSLGERLIENKEKYGYENWYDWRNVNWGVKWNGADSHYEIEEGEGKGDLSFDTAWVIPYPIIGKIAEDNPQYNLHCYSEEETGWFDDYEMKDGKIHIIASGEVEWDEDTDECTETRNPVDKTFTFEEIMQDSIKQWDIIHSNWTL